ncbi:hypothetical protein L208DRAFT_1286330, partial [Tricholoma matsutake]
VPDRYHECILYLRPEETRGICHRILEIFDMLCFRRRVLYLLLFEGPKEMRVSFEGPEETMAICAPIPMLSHTLP